jgi:hypothetical protein
VEVAMEGAVVVAVVVVVEVVAVAMVDATGA